MKALILLLAVFGCNTVLAASAYTCTVEGEPQTFTMTPTAEGMVVDFSGEKQTCQIEETPEVLVEINKGLKDNLDIAFDAAVAVTCLGQVADGTVIFLVSKTGINGMPMNTIISSPVVGPMGGATCTAQ